MRSLLRGYRDNLLSSLDIARSVPSLPFGGRAVALYGFVLLYCLLWALLGPASRPDLFFNEGGPIDGLSTILFTTAAVTAWIVFWLVRGSGTPAAWFWLASAGGLAFFAIDDRFQLHERFGDWMEPAFGAAPLGFRNWNDIAVLGYGAVGLVLLAAALPAILRYRQTAVFLMVAFLCYGTHTFIDSTVRRAPAKEISEEIFKLLTGASLVMAYLQGTLAAGTSGLARRPFFRRHAAALGVVTAVLVSLMYLGDIEWHRELGRKWGPPDSWLASMYLGTAALLCWFSWLPTRPGGHCGNALLCAAATCLGWLAFDEATLSGWTVLHNAWTPPLVSELLDGGLAYLHRSLTVSAVVAVGAAVPLLVLWRRRMLMQWRTVALMGVAIGCLVAAAAIAPFAEDTLRGLLGSVLRLTACASVVLAAMVEFTARVTAVAPDLTGERPPRRRALAHAAAWVAVVSLVVVAARMKQLGINPFARFSDDGFSGILHDGDYFGRSVALMGSLDGVGLVDLAVGTPGDDAGGENRGAVWMLSIERDGRVAARHKITGGFSGSAMDPIGRSVASLGDLDGDGVADLAVGAHTDGDGGSRRGAVWVLFLERDGTIRSHQKISSTQGGFAGALDDGDQFGCSLAPLGDLDGDGIPDLAVGARSDDDGGPGRGAVWVLFLNRDGTVKTHRKISGTTGGLDAGLDDGDRFGESMAALGDFNGDGVIDLVVGAEDDDDGGADRGAVWLLFLGADGAVKSHAKISSTQGGFTGVLADDDDFGHSVAAVGDIDGDGVIDIAVGADEDKDGGPSRGAVWVLLLNADGTVKAHQKISSTRGGFKGALYDGDEFGESVAAPGDLDGDGVADLLVGTKDDGVGRRNRGAVWVLFLRTDGTVATHAKVGQ